MEVNKEWKNDYEIVCIKNNDYKKLSEYELE